ncbi:MAG: hypothetical protein JWN01_993 [Patescibacteria group bacterium]|nr:hypothetical protein [Patescibacteria group bacterium]
MTAVLARQAGATLAYKGLLDTHGDEMVRLLVTDYDEHPIRAAAMVDQYWGMCVTGIIKDNKTNEFWGPAIAGIVEGHGYADPDPDTALAELILNEALGFLQASAENSGLGPSLLVDWGWHQLKSPTKQYTVLSRVLAGRFLHHEPTGLVLPDGFDDGRPEHTMADTVNAMRQRGPVLDLLWTTSGNCGNPCDGCCNMRCKVR